ncbi:Farnesyl pyrophosphate synthase [Paramuricea clavata]|uniref:Farnesyl pyrophosphate synthase n=1 Tax=Paramuricea clavata TaxID=317549 RepID=A0A6S7I6S5_PARCT|nr:Farnesyl pyrophosphate synthase [Paramuricea clavata]
MAEAIRKAQVQEDRRHFDEALPKVIEQILGPRLDETSDAVEHLKRNILYNLAGGKMNRGMTVLSTWRLLLGDKTPTDEEYYCATVLAWCVEFLQAFFLVTDDVMDQSVTRRGKLKLSHATCLQLELYCVNQTHKSPDLHTNQGISGKSSLELIKLSSRNKGEQFRTDRAVHNTGSIRNDPYWTSRRNSLELIELSSINKEEQFRTDRVIQSLRENSLEDPDIELIAVNDAVMLESCVHRLIDINFKSKECYGNIITLMHETTFQTETGQTLDLITKPGENFCNFTLKRYKAIVKWKTAFYSFYLPVALAMYMDDYLDCYGDPAVTGKVGTDIEETKCSWLLVQALQRVDEEQMNVLKENYGINDPVAVAKVKEVYSKLDMKTVYHDYEKISYGKLMQLINKAPSGLPQEIFTELAAKIYKRDK